MHNALARAGTGGTQFPQDLSAHNTAWRRVQRRDGLIASAVLMLLLAGWVMNFVDARQLALRLNDLMIASHARQV